MKAKKSETGGKQVKEIGKRLRKLRIIDIVQNHGGHVGPENGISTKQVAEILNCERKEVIDEMYSVKLYFRAIGKNLLRHKPPKGDSIYYFAADAEEESLGLETHLKRIFSTLRSLGKEIIIGQRNFPELAFTHEAIRIEDGVVLQIENPLSYRVKKEE